MNEYYNKHYIRTDASGSIVEGWSDGPHNHRAPSEDDILLTDKGGYQFRLVVAGATTEENPPLFDMDMIPLYKWDGNEVLQRSEEEIEIDREEKRKEQEKEALKPTQLDRIESQVTYTALMTDTLLEE